MSRSKRNKRFREEVEQLTPFIVQAQGKCAAAIMYLSRLLGDPRNAQDHTRNAVLSLLAALNLIGVEVDVDEDRDRVDQPSDEAS